MPDEIEEVGRSFDDLVEIVGVTPPEEYPVRGRGRPKSSPEEADRKLERHKAFGAQMKLIREQSNLTLTKASDAAGIASARKLSQYETTCYPPGWVIAALAPVYDVDVRYLAALTIQNSDPDMFMALTSCATAEEFMAQFKE